MSTNWLGELEHQVERVTGELAAVRRESSGLKSKLQRLRRELAEARGDEAARDAWATEREELRRRLARLIERLESLV